MMKFMYPVPRLLPDVLLTQYINNAAEQLYYKLKNTDLSQIGLSDYNQNYLKQDHLSNLTRTLQKYSYILANSLYATRYQDYSKIVFLEYGGGIGILSLLARQAGIGTVLYNDIYDVSCKDAQRLGETLGIPAHHYICGDIDQVIEYVVRNNIQCHAMASYDVIEHIYDIEAFFKKIPAISSYKNFTIFMSSGANKYNPRIRRSLQNLHQEHEYADRSNQWGHKKRDCLQSFFSVRKAIITQYAPNLSSKEIDLLAQATRGKIKQDIIDVINAYLNTGVLPAIPANTDTCDPYTGNWSEHLLDSYHLVELLQRSGFDARILNGYYGYQESLAKRYIGNALNLSMRYIPARVGLCVAPFYTIFGVRKIIGL